MGQIRGKHGCQFLEDLAARLRQRLGSRLFHIFHLDNIIPKAGSHEIADLSFLHVEGRFFKGLHHVPGGKISEVSAVFGGRPFRVFFCKSRKILSRLGLLQNSKSFFLDRFFLFFRGVLSQFEENVPRSHLLFFPEHTDVVLVVDADLPIADLHFVFEAIRIDHQVSQLDFFRNTVRLFVFIKVFFQSGFIDLNRIPVALRQEFHKTDLDRFVVEIILVSQLFLGHRRESHEELCDLFLKQFLSHGRFEVLGFHAVVLKQGHVSSLVELALKLETGVGHDLLLNLLFRNIQTDPFCFLADQFLTDDGFQGSVFQIKHLNEVLIPRIAILSLEAFE